MGGRLGRNRAANDPFYNAGPPAPVYPSVSDPSGGLDIYDPYEEYGYEPIQSQSIGNLYRGSVVPRTSRYGGLYAQGLNQMPGVSPWNYGNYYLGNTTMQMMPFMMNKVAKFGQIQAMAALGNSGLLGAAPAMPSMPCCMPQVCSMPCCIPQACSMPAMAPSMPPSYSMPIMAPSMPPSYNMSMMAPSMAPSYNLSMMPRAMPPSYSIPMMPPSIPQPYSMPMMPPSMPQSYSMPAGAPMMAAATPLPVAFNPLVQGMYPMASTSPANWMTPSSFMSALASGPMPYRPPALDFPSNVGMVMTIPYGTPNPMLSSPTYNSANSSYSSGGGGGSSWCCCYYCMSPPASPSAPPAISYYPRPVSVPQPYSVPYPAPVPLPNIQQVPIPRPVSIVAPPIVAGCNQPLPIVPRDPLWPSQDAFINGALGQPSVMASSQNSTRPISMNNESMKGSLPVYSPTDQSNSLIGERISSSLSNSVADKIEQPNVTISKAKYSNQSERPHETTSDRLRRFLPAIPRFTQSNYAISTRQRRTDPILPPILHGELISDSGWISKSSESQTVPPALTKKKRRLPLYATENIKSMLHTHGNRVSFLPRRRRHNSSSSASEYDCAICQQQREKRRLREHYGSSTLSSLLSSPKDSGNRLVSSNDSVVSSTLYSPPAYEKESYKAHKRHPTTTKRKSKLAPSDKSNSPILLRKIPLQDQRLNVTIHEVDEEEEVDEEKEKPFEKKLFDDNDSSIGKSDHHASQNSLGSKDE